MKKQPVVLSGFVLGLTLVGCSSEATNAAPSTSSKPSSTAMAALTQDDLMAIWPEDGSKVYSSFDMVIGGEGDKVPGSLCVVMGDPVPAGSAPGAGAIKFAKGSASGAVSLPVGKQKVVVQALDDAGMSLGPDVAHTVTYEVIAKPTSQRVFFVEPEDGATVKGKLHVVFGVEGMTMSKALENSLDKTMGHHHIIVNKGIMAASLPIPKDGVHIHYGDAQTEADLDLEPGTYTLTMQYADGNHRSYGKRLSHSITVTVE